MAKIALLFSGDPQHWSPCVDSQLGLFREHEVDVFFHFWDTVDRDEKQRIVDAYRPKAHLFEPPVDFSSWEPQFTRVDQLNSPAPMLRMYYSWKQVAALFEDYRDEAGARYDYLIKLRSDLMFFDAIDHLLPELRLNALFISNEHAGNDSDTFALGSPELILHYLSLYDQLPAYQDHVTCTPDCLLAHHLNGNDMGVRVLPISLKMQVCKQTVGPPVPECVPEQPISNRGAAPKLSSRDESAKKAETANEMPEFAALTEFAQARVQAQKPVPLTLDKLQEAFETHLPTVQVVSFDIFDTLLLRRVGHPMDVFLHLEHQPAFRRHTFPRSVAELRVEAEKLARRRLYDKQGSGEVVLPEIYVVFCELAKLPSSAVAEFVAAEEAVELKLCRPNPRLQAFFQRTIGMGKRIVALSDTYHRCDFLVQLLEAVGAPLEKTSIFASSEWRVNKQSGQLFGKVFDHLGIARADLLHIGDHPISDFEMPRKLGAKALLHGHHGGGNPRTVVAPSEDGRLQSLFRAQNSFAARCGHQSGQFWWLLGHNTFGPLIAGFCLWLCRMFRADRIDRAYFLLRDGEIFYRVFETLFPDHAGLPSLQRLPASRRAYVFPLLEIAPNFVMPNLMVGSVKRPVGEFLSRLDLPVSDFVGDIRDCGFRSVDELIDGRRDTRRLEGLFRRPRIHDALRRQANREKDILVGYLRQQGMLAPGRIALIDLGWHGTIHKACHLLGQAHSPESHVFGYYLAAFPKFLHFVPNGLKFSAYFGPPGDFNALVRGIDVFPQLLEIVCSSASGSLRNFTQSGLRFDPVFQANPASDEQLQALNEIHNGIVDFAREFRATPFDLRADDISPALAASNLLRLLENPSKEEALRIGELVHGDDFGSGNVRYAARFRPMSSSPEAIWKDYLNAYWKKGMLNQPTPQGSALRTLWWLMQP